MKAEARRALGVIRRCVAAGRFALTIHFSRRIQQRGLFWPDVQAVLDDPRDVRSQGLDGFGRAKWLIGGGAVNVGPIEIVCAIETDAAGVEFITLFWKD